LGTCKLPAIQFYPGDWRKDVGVQSLNYFDRGVWLEMLLLMHDSPVRGKLMLGNGAMSDEALARILHIETETLKKTLSTLLECGVTERETRTGALINRRMLRDELERSRNRGKLHSWRKAKKTQEECNQDVTTRETDLKPLSSSSISTSSSTSLSTAKQKQKTIARSVPPEELAGTLPLANGTEFQVSKADIDRWAQAFPGVSVKQELKKFKAWCEDNPGRKKTAKGIKSAVFRWLDKAQNSGGGNGRQDQKRTESNAGITGGEDGPDLYAALYGTVEQGKLN